MAGAKAKRQRKATKTAAQTKERKKRNRQAYVARQTEGLTEVQMEERRTTESAARLQRVKDKNEYAYQCGYDEAARIWKRMYDAMESKMNVSKMQNQQLKRKL